ncbi:MAG: rhodanese-like domain-containing protein [Bradyrhizobium sp.]
MTGAMRIFGMVVLLQVALVAGPLLANEDLPEEPTGYWQGPMNGRVPATISGGIVLNAEELAPMLREKQSVLIDVHPAPRKPAEQTTPWLPTPHKDITGSVWIPGAGSGVISATMEQYFRDRLGELTGLDRDRMIVFYCRPDCWASWNAAKRAIAMGYRRVGWFPGGVEAWQKAGLPTETASAEGPAAQ